MAETKRHSIAGKVATPKIGSSVGTTAQTNVDILDNLHKAIGARVKITTIAPQTQIFEGTLFTADPILNLVAINVRSPPPNPTSNAAAQPGADPGDVNSANLPPSVGPTDTKRMLQREADRIRKLKEDEQNRGKGVTAEGQAIFDSFKRINLPIRWHNQEMIVHDAVIISPPYTVDNCRGAKDKQETLNRVKKVLEGERRKLKEKEERERKNGAPRKGG